MSTGVWSNEENVSSVILYVVYNGDFINPVTYQLDDRLKFSRVLVYSLNIQISWNRNNTKEALQIKTSVSRIHIGAVDGETVAHMNGN